MAEFFYLIFLLATYIIPIIADGSSPPSPSPSPTTSPTNCIDVVMGMMDCSTYIEEGSKENKPLSTCCNELKTVVNKSPGCLCEGIKMTLDYVIKIDMKRATGLPHACDLPSSDFGGCDATSVPSPGLPAPSPSPPLSPPPQVSTPSPVSTPVPPPPSVPTPPPASPPTPPQHPPAPPVSPPTPAPKNSLVEPPVQSFQPPSLAPSQSSSWKLSFSMLALCVGVAIASFTYLDA